MTDDSLGVVVPAALTNGVPMQKISSKKIKQVIVRLKDGAIVWTSRTGSKIPISSIRELRLNQPPDDTYASKRWISIVYVRSSQWKVFHMVALSDEVYTLWVNTLKQLVSETTDRLINDIPASDPDMIWIRQLWPAGARTIDVDAAVGLCKQIGLEVPLTSMNKLAGPLDCAAFRDLVRDMQSRPEVDSLYDELARGGLLDRVKVENFLRDTQKIEPGDIFDTFAQAHVWTVESLCDFLASPVNATRKPIDMTKPLQDYFISSSHNTYLVGEQWRGESTVEGYIRVLLAKCRCVEIDMHDGEFEPLVYHKKTLTSKVPVRDILRAINKYGFVASPYPVIISAEVHCSSDQQEVLGQILRDVFGDRLVSHRIDDSPYLPSPEALQGKVLFKTKPPTTAVSPKLDAFPPDSTSSTESDSGISRLARRLSIQSSEKSSFSQSLTDLLVYTAGVKYQGFSKLVQYQPRHQFSVSERTAARIIKENQADWIKHNFSHISRVYPKGARVNSTNYNPIPLWCAGAQLVAVNWQTIDEGAILNQAMFADSDGYVLKPRALREKIQEPVQTYQVRIEIISAQRLPLASDLYVEATLDATNPQNECVTRRTSAIRGTSLNPLWSETLSFEICTTRSLFDLTFVHLEIKNKSLLAQWIRPVSAAPRGYHHLPLYDPLFSRYVFATLFVRIDVDSL